MFRYRFPVCGEVPKIQFFLRPAPDGSHEATKIGVTFFDNFLWGAILGLLTKKLINWKMPLAVFFLTIWILNYTASNFYSSILLNYSFLQKKVVTKFKNLLILLALHRNWNISLHIPYIFKFSPFAICPSHSSRRRRVGKSDPKNFILKRGSAHEFTLCNDVPRFQFQTDLCA